MVRKLSSELALFVQKAQKAQTCVTPANKREADCLRRAVTAGKLVSPVPCLYAEPTYWEDQSPRSRTWHILRGLQKLHPTWVFCSMSAAVVHGLAMSNSALDVTRVAVTRDTHSRSCGRIVRQVVPDDTTQLVGGLRVTSFVRTVFDCLRELDLPHGLAVADSALRVGKLTKDQMIEQFKQMSGKSTGGRHAIAVMGLADARAESGGESISRGRLIELGYQVPELQVEVPNPVEGGVFRGDFGWRLAADHWLFGELDGREKYINPEMTHGKDAVDVLLDERMRESRVSASGVTVMRFSYKDMMDDVKFRKILEAYQTPHATEQVYRGEGVRFKPVGLSSDYCRKDVKKRACKHGEP